MKPNQDEIVKLLENQEETELWENDELWEEAIKDFSEAIMKSNEKDRVAVTAAMDAFKKKGGKIKQLPPQAGGKNPGVRSKGGKQYKNPMDFHKGKAE